MVDEQLTQIIRIFDQYLSLVENPSIIQNVTSENISKAFDCCLFVEATIIRAEQENKLTIIQGHLHGHWSAKNRTKLYTWAELQFACDKMLEVFLKCPSITTDIIDKLLNLYVQHCGRERLGIFLENVLTNSLPANVLCNTVVELGLPLSTIHNEARLVAWDNEAAIGRHDEVDQAISQMIDDGQLNNVFEILSSLNKNSPAIKLIMKNLTRRTDAYDVSICRAITEVNRKLLRQLVVDTDFRISLVDAIFYFGRNMHWDGESWKAQDEFNYDNLVKIFRLLFTVSDEVFNFVNNRLKLSKAQDMSQMDCSIWVQIEKDCADYICDN